MPKRVVALGFRGFPAIEGGIETHAEQLYTRIAGTDYRVHALTRSSIDRSPKPYRYNGVLKVPLFAAGPGSIENMIHSFLGCLYAHKVSADLLHIHGIGPAVFAPMARALGVPVVVTHHGKDYDAKKWNIFQRTLLHFGESIGMRFASARITVSDNIRRHVHIRYNKQAFFIPNGASPLPEPECNEILTELGLEKNHYVIQVARVTEHKGQADLIDAFSRSGLTDVKLVLVGECPSGEPYADSVRAMSSQQENIVLAGFRNGDELASLYRNAAAFALPSSYEGMPIAVLEAMTCGLPMVLSNIPAHTALPLDKESFFPLNNPEALMDCLKRAVGRAADDSYRQKVKSSSHRFDWNVIAARTADVFQSVLR